MEDTDDVHKARIRRSNDGAYHGMLYDLYVDGYHIMEHTQEMAAQGGFHLDPSQMQRHDSECFDPEQYGYDQADGYGYSDEASYNSHEAYSTPAEGGYAHAHQEAGHAYAGYDYQAPQDGAQYHYGGEEDYGVPDPPTYEEVLEEDKKYK